MANVDSSGMLVAGKIRLKVKHGDLSQVQVCIVYCRVCVWTPVSADPDDLELKGRRD